MGGPSAGSAGFSEASHMMMRSNNSVPCKLNAVSDWVFQVPTSKSHNRKITFNTTNVTCRHTRSQAAKWMAFWADSV